MRLLVDLGNTRLKCAFATADELLAVHAFTHAQDDFVTQLDTWLACHEVVEEVWLASVANTQLTETVESLLRAKCRRIQRVMTQSTALGLTVAYAEAGRMGVDRWLALLALHVRQAAPCVVVSVGSALTIDGLAVDGQHLGGLIAPAPEGMREALFLRAPALARARGNVVAFATSTQDAIESGCVLAGVALIERSLREMTSRLMCPVALHISGGGGAALENYLPPHEVHQDLVLHGLWVWSNSMCVGE